MRAWGLFGSGGPVAPRLGGGRCCLEISSFVNQSKEGFITCSS